HFAGEVGNAPEHGLANELQPVLDMLNVLMPAQRPSEPDPTPAPDPDPTLPPPGDFPPPPPSSNFLQNIWKSFRSFWRNLFN
ncbi:MAG: hypothetical protein GY805_34370, partial [Chloroflexi bacterium]|nr:hypothetical protein [Chloroflexota bacterium]